MRLYINIDWPRFYNATQVTPIWHRGSDGSRLIFGFLTVDSPNPANLVLFDKEVTLSIMTFGADLLALLFLALDMYDGLLSGNLSRSASGDMP